MNQHSAAFTPETSRDLLDAACRSAGMDSSGARLLRHHTNAVYQLVHQPVVVKITRPGSSRDRVAQTVAIAEALAGTDVPSVRLWPGLKQPLTVAESQATFWATVEMARGSSAADLAEPLRLLHDLDAELLPTVPKLDPFGAINASLSRRTVLELTDLQFLHDYAEELADQYATLDFERPNCLIHADAHHSNTLVGPSGPVLADWESARTGPPEWDLVTVAVHCRRFGHPPDEYSEFAKRYGRDVHVWSGYQILSAVRELRMITTNAWKSLAHTPAAVEVRRRVAGLRDGDPDFRWQLL